MARTLASAKAAGSSFEKLVATYLAETLPTGDFIERRRLQGTLDTGDIAGVRTTSGQRVAIECKNVKKMALGPWIEEARVEALNDGAAAGIVIHKRHGKGAPESQLVSMTLRDLVVLLGGDPGKAAT